MTDQHTKRGRGGADTSGLGKDDLAGDSISSNNKKSLKKNQRRLLCLGDLAGSPRWIAWRKETKQNKDGSERDTKIPYNPHTKRRARIPTHPSTWGTREEAERRWAKLDDGRPGGIGIVLSELDDGRVLMGLDLDLCVTKKGNVLSWANDIIDRFDTYAEFSPSGRGIKLLFLVEARDKVAVYELLGGSNRKKFSPGKRREVAIDRERYYAITEEQVGDTPESFRVVDVEDIRWFVEEAGPSYLRRYRKTKEGEESSTRDMTGSGHGITFLWAYRKRGDSYETAKDAILSDTGPEGEWARREGDSAIKRAWDKTKKTEKPKPKARYALTPMSAVKEKPVEWFWDGFIPASVLTTAYGDSDVGKSTVLIDIAAKTTRGDPLPACETGKKGSVIILTKEDALAGILKPRLRAAKADMDKVYTITHEGTGDDDLPPEVIDRLDMGLDEVERLIAKIGDVKLIIIDVWASFVGDVKTYDDSSVRKLLEPLANLAARYGIAIVGISHLSKKIDLPVKQRAIGGVGFINVPRAALLVARDPDNPDERRIMVQVANRLSGTRHDALAFSFEAMAGERHDVRFPSIEWEEEIFTVDPDELMERREEKDPGKLEQAEDLLKEWLSKGSMSLDEIKERMKFEKISWATVRRAQSNLPIKSFPEDGEQRWLLKFVP